MPSLNKVFLIGNLTRDPELRKSPNGVPVAKLRIASNETFRDRQTGQAKEVTCYVDVTVWDKAAENCGAYLSRGSQVLVEGRLIYDEWKTPQGETRSRLGVRADRIQFLNTASARRTDGQGQPPQPPRVAQQPGGTAPDAPPATSAPPPPPPAAEGGDPTGEDDDNLPPF